MQLYLHCISQSPKGYCCCCCSSVTKLCPTLGDPMDYSTPGFPVLHLLLEFAQAHVHWVRDAIQPSHPLSPSSPPAFSLSQHQGLFLWASYSHRWPKYWSFSFSISPSNGYSVWISLGWTGCISLQSKGLSRVVLALQYKKIDSLVLSLLYGPTLTTVHDYWKNHRFDYMDRSQQSDVFALFGNILKLN